MLAEAVRDELVERNVASIVRGPRIDHEEVRPWSLDDAATFLAAASAHRLSALFAVGVAVGLRRSELLAVAWDDVDLDGGVQRLQGQGLVYGPPKSTRSRRSIPLPESSRAALLSHRGLPGVGAADGGELMAGVGPGLHNVRKHGCGAAKSVQDIRASGAAGRRASDPVPRPMAHVCVAASAGGCVAPGGDGRAGPFSAFDHNGFVLMMPSALRAQTRWIGRSAEFDDRQSMLLTVAVTVAVKTG
jgi:integrase